MGMGRAGSRCSFPKNCRRSISEVDPSIIFAAGLF
jgi:hypothetical protein